MRMLMTLVEQRRRLMNRCWITRTPYDEAKYLKALKERGSPLLSVETT